jgi:hypothetical protein
MQKLKKKLVSLLVIQITIWMFWLTLIIFILVISFILKNTIILCFLPFCIYQVYKLQSTFVRKIKLIKITIYMREIELGIKEKDTKNPFQIEIEEILNSDN